MTKRDALDELLADLGEEFEFARRYLHAGPAISELLKEWRHLAPTCRDPLTDSTGAVQIRVDEYGIAESIELMPGWRRLVGAHGVAAAVSEACLGVVMAGWERAGSAAEASGLDRRLAELVSYVDGTGPEPAWVRASAGSTSEFGVVGVDAGSGGPPESLVGEWSGVSARGAVKVTLDVAGVVTCEADPSWLSLRETHEINDSLAAALASARAQRPSWAQHALGLG